MEDELKKILEYAERQSDYCKIRSKESYHDTSKYSKNNMMTDEQMSGYYQGRGEANWAIIDMIKDILKEINANPD